MRVEGGESGSGGRNLCLGAADDHVIHTWTMGVIIRVD
jgi:hypothetical protein